MYGDIWKTLPKETILRWRNVAKIELLSFDTSGYILDLVHQVKDNKHLIKRLYDLLLETDVVRRRRID